MHYFFVDASALVKRYHHESGSDVINHLFDTLLHSSPERIAITPLILSETISVLSRKHHGGSIPLDLYQKATARLLLETRLMNSQSIDDETILHSIPFVHRYNLNASDALHLFQALNLKNLLKNMEHDLILLTSDRRLLRATDHEGLLTLNPEEAAQEDLEAFLQI